MQCLVTGKVAPVARLACESQRVRGAQPSGATLVGFNAAAYKSYNGSQGQKAPVSEEATFRVHNDVELPTLRRQSQQEDTSRRYHCGLLGQSDNRAYEPAFAGIIDPAYLEQDEIDQTGRKERKVRHDRRQEK